MKEFKPVFLFCTERCGSNFITKLMNNHSKICGPSTKHIINPLARNYFRYLPFTKKNWDQLLNDVLSLFNVSFSTWKTRFYLEELQKNVKRGDVVELITYIFNKETVALQKEISFIKEIKSHEFFPFLKQSYPNAKYIYQVRDPRDMALSWKKSGSHKGGIIAAAKQWKNDQQQYLKIKAIEEINNNIAFLKYEELVANTENELKKICMLLNIDFERGMLEMGKDNLTNKNASQQEAWKNLAKPIITNNFNKYREELTSDEIALIERICFFEMKHLGYEPENNWENLVLLSSKDIGDFHRKEIEELEYIPVRGVIANMEAKKRFYEKI